MHIIRGFDLYHRRFKAHVMIMITLLYCIIAICLDPTDPANGMVSFTTTSIDDTATYKCNEGFELIGVTSTTCTGISEDSAAFSPDAPTCRRKFE